MIGHHISRLSSSWSSDSSVKELMMTGCNGQVIRWWREHDWGLRLVKIISELKFGLVFCSLMSNSSGSARRRCCKRSRRTFYTILAHEYTHAWSLELISEISRSNKPVLFFRHRRLSCNEIQTCGLKKRRKTPQSLVRVYRGLYWLSSR